MSASSLQFYFSPVRNVYNISLDSVNYTLKDETGDNKKKKKNKNKDIDSKNKSNKKKEDKKDDNTTTIKKEVLKYYYLSAQFDNDNGKTHLQSKGEYFTLDSFYIVGALSNAKKENASLVISFKAVNAIQPGEDIPIVYMCFPLNINKNKKDENFITHILTDTDEKRHPFQFDELMEMSYDQRYEFEHMNYRNKKNKIDVDIYFYPETLNVYYEPNDDKQKKKQKLHKKAPVSSNELRWITADIQDELNIYEPLNLIMFMDNPTAIDNTDNFTTLWDWDKDRDRETLYEPLETITAIENPKLTDEDQIYIQCAPAGASEQTEMVHTNARDGKHGKSAEQNHLSFLLLSTVAIFINVLFVGLGYRTIYLVLSRFFIENVIESKNSRHTDKRRPDPFQMLVYWFADIIPHFLSSQWGEGNKRTSAEQVIRVFVYAFYFAMLLMFVYSSRKKKWNLANFAAFIIFVFVADIFFFFIQIYNMNREQYQELRDEKMNL